MHIAQLKSAIERRFGLKEVENPHAPRVFENGRPISVLEAGVPF